MNRGFLRNACCLLVPAVSAVAGLRDPFPAGFAMGTLGAIVDERGASGREPWTSASLCADTSGFGFEAGGISYFGPALSAGGGDGIGQAFGGGWLAIKHCVLKASISSLTALKAYYEQAATVSVGTNLMRLMRLSIEAAGWRMGAAVPGAADRTIGEAGAGAWVPWSWAALSLRCEHLVLASSLAEGGDPPLTVRAGLHTAMNRYGSQGATITVRPSEPRPVSFSVAEEFRITPSVAFAASLADNPLLVGFGVRVSIRSTAAGVAFVNHPVLGWSQGFAAAWSRP